MLCKSLSFEYGLKMNFCVSPFAAVRTWAAVTHHLWREQSRGTAPWATSAAPCPRMMGPSPSPHWPAASTLWSVVFQRNVSSFLQGLQPCKNHPDQAILAFLSHHLVHFWAPSLIQVPFYRGERITFDVAPSRMDFRVEHTSLKLEVKSLTSCWIWFYLRHCVEK